MVCLVASDLCFGASTSVDAFFFVGIKLDKYFYM